MCFPGALVCINEHGRLITVHTTLGGSTLCGGIVLGVKMEWRGNYWDLQMYTFEAMFTSGIETNFTSGIETKFYQSSLHKIQHLYLTLTSLVPYAVYH